MTPAYPTRTRTRWPLLWRHTADWMVYDSWDVAGHMRIVRELRPGCWNVALVRSPFEGTFLNASSDRLGLAFAKLPWVLLCEVVWRASGRRLSLSHGFWLRGGVHAYYLDREGRDGRFVRLWGRR